ncbi:hypothetical protein Goshw_007365 [Gossypium schwendimanii]|uniref:Uncharacterized protein n=1 Tax=Gossypium schwendimanii TaxID=34291 RepID=A0A7J9LLF1_GOSSC|nr:hypothetical protein [Gossypium schwendimanii]
MTPYVEAKLMQKEPPLAHNLLLAERSCEALTPRAKHVEVTCIFQYPNNFRILVRQDSNKLISFGISWPMRSEPLLVREGAGENSSTVTATLVLSNIVAACISFGVGYINGYTSPTQSKIMEDLSLSITEVIENAGYTYHFSYVAPTNAVKQAVWLRKIITNLNLYQRETTEVNCDNQSAVAIAKNPVFHGRTKQFKIKFHFVREMEQANEVKLIHCSSEDQLADILTKPFNVSRFEYLRMRLGVCSKQAKEEC